MVEHPLVAENTNRRSSVVEHPLVADHNTSSSVVEHPLVAEKRTSIERLPAAKHRRKHPEEEEEAELAISPGLEYLEDTEPQASKPDVQVEEVPEPFFASGPRPHL